jgi:hypothetical protein
MGCFKLAQFEGSLRLATKLIARRTNITHRQPPVKNQSYNHTVMNTFLASPNTATAIKRGACVFISSTKTTTIKG